MGAVAVIGLGSIVRQDDGVGVRVVEQLRGQNLPGGVSLFEGELAGVDLVQYCADYDRLIVVDAADMGCPPGTVKQFDSVSIRKANFTQLTSTHGMGVLEALTLAEKLEYECKIEIIGIQPKDMDFGLEMSPVVTEAIPAVVRLIKEVIG